MNVTKYAISAIVSIFFALSCASAETEAPTPKRDFQAMMSSYHEQTPAQPPVEAGGMLRGLALCIGVFLIGVAVWKRIQGVPVNTIQKRRMRVLERLTLTTKSALCLVEIDGKTHVIATGSDPVTSITHTPIAEPRNNILTLANPIEEHDESQTKQVVGVRS